ncbi:unnamed protein product, partial [Rotaria magnacalcarata]
MLVDTVIPLRGCSVDIHPNARWKQNGLTVSGGNGQGNGINQLSNPCGLYVDDDQTVYVADQSNHRIVEWKSGATSGQVVAGVVVDQLGTVYVADDENDRIMRWPKGATQGSVIVGGNGGGGQSNQLNGPEGSSFDRHVHPNARWKQNGLTVAGRNGQGYGINQLSYPWGLYVDDDQTVYVADQYNHRIVEWKSGATSGQVVAGGNEEGSGDHQLSNPRDVIVDKERDSLIISDYSNERVVQWPRRNETSGETIISNINCWGLTMDENGSLYVADIRNDEVRRYKKGESQGTVVAGGNGRGNRFDQLSYPRYVFVDR